MLPKLTSNDPSEGLLREEYISFNIKRTCNNHSNFPRKVTIFNPAHVKNTIVPGLKERGESELLEELKKYQNWREVKRHSFSLPPHLFSLLWRFRKDQGFVLKKVHPIKPLKKNESKDARIAYKKYRESLQSNLRAGQVFLIPDAEVTFQRPGRYTHGYSRRVLVIHTKGDQIMIIPFSTRIDRINEKTDILFDSHYKGKRLNPSEIPAVENFPYKIFSQKTVLCVCAAQLIRREDFIESALLLIGPLEKSLLDFVQEKMK
jgi:hypothetical protein